MNIEWSAHVSEKEGFFTSLRVNESIDDYICHPQYRFFLGLSVCLKKVDETGFPYEEEKNVLAELEDLIIEQLVDNQLCVLTAVLTSQGNREFMLYTYTPEQCEKVIAVLKDNWVYHDIQYVLEEDANWNVFEALIN